MPGRLGSHEGEVITTVAVSKAEAKAWAEKIEARGVYHRVRTKAVDLGAGRTVFQIIGSTDSNRVLKEETSLAVDVTSGS